MAPAMRTDSLSQGRASTRQRILTAAAHLFARDGFDATTVKDIARECQLTDPALYYHFDSKRDILDALLVEPPVARIPLASVEQPTRAALIDDVCAVFDFWTDHVALLRLLYRQALQADPETSALAGKIGQSAERLLMPSLEAIYGADAGRIYDVISTLLTGVNLDAIIELGEDYRAGVSSPGFRNRLYRLVQAALPPAP